MPPKKITLSLITRSKKYIEAMEELQTCAYQFPEKVREIISSGNLWEVDEMNSEDNSEIVLLFVPSKFLIASIRAMKLMLKEKENG